MVDASRKARQPSDGTVESRIKLKTKDLETKNSHLERTNEQLRRQLFDYRQREAEFERYSDERVHLFSVLDKSKEEKAQIISTYQERLLRAQDSIQGLLNQYDNLKEQNALLLSKLDSLSATGSSSSPLRVSKQSVSDADDSQFQAAPDHITSPMPTVIRLQAQLRSLQIQYDKLLESKKKVSRSWRADWKRWKMFKQYVVSNKENLERVSHTFQEFQASLEYNDKDASNDDVAPEQMDVALGDSGIVATSRELANQLIEPPHPQESMTQCWTYQDSEDIRIPSRQQDNSPKSTPKKEPVTPKRRSLCQEPLAPAASSPLYVPSTPDSKREEKSINSLFEINQVRNSGANHEYHAVVRDKKERRHLEAGDCECCRDYYNAVGRLPPRLHAPLWASPSKTTPGTFNGDKDLSGHLQAHRQEVSRHRQQWTGPATPPDYWEISFPDTQQVHEINDRAADMHRQKRKYVEREASRPDGKYKRRAAH